MKTAAVQGGNSKVSEEAAPAIDIRAASLRPTWAEVDLDAFRHNVRLVRQLTGSKPRIMAVVKSNAYGHGVFPCARAAVEAGAEWLGVATTDEALELRETRGFDLIPILVMAPTLEEEAEALQRADVAVSVGSIELLRTHITVAERHGNAARIHVQLDTGIGRDGFRYDDMSWLEELHGKERHLEGIFTHFTSSDSMEEEDVAYTKLQIARFSDALGSAREAGLSAIAHAANSGAIVNHPNSFFDMVRPGIMLYGCNPNGVWPPSVPLRHVLKLRSRIAALRQMEAGDHISYGRRYTLAKAGPIGVVPVGYGDGYLRAFGNLGEVLVRGHRVPIRGRVCMDQFMIDLSEVPDAQLGDEVVIYGRQGEGIMPIEEAAAKVGTITYELSCSLTPRVPRRYVG